MLNYNKKGTYTDPQGVPWVYYQDDVNASIFYIVPTPTWVLDENGKPEIKVMEYSSDLPTSGSGYVIINAQLTVPDEVVAGVKGEIPKQFPGVTTIQLNPMDFNPGCTAQFTLDVSGTPTDFIAKASEFGSNVASFRADLDKDGMNTIKGLLTTAGGGLDVTYNLNVPARLNAVTATLEFDSSIAYQYQVTHAQHHAYAADTPRSVTKLLKESNSSTIHLAWGISNPSSDLVTAVTTWANDTIGDLVSAEVNTALSLLKESSYDSFNINEVSSFKSVYSTDQVINWKLYPKAALPAVTDLASHTTTVNQRKQVMTISAHLPFKGDKVKGTNVPKVDAKPVLLQKLTAKVTYPGLTEANGTYVFTANGSHTFTAPYDTTQGDSYDVAWTAEYADGSQQPVSGSATVTKGEYAINLPSVGILSITFDATQAFAPLTPAKGSTTPPVVTSIDIDFHFADPQGGGTAIHQKKTIQAPAAKPTGGGDSLAADAKPEPLQAVFTSYIAHNVVTGTAYSYFVTYHFAEGPDFVGTETNSTSYNETVPQPPAPHPIPIVIVAKVANTTSGGGTEPTVIDANVNVWFDTDVSIPGAGPQPTKDNPTAFSLVPATKNGVMFVRDIFDGFLNGDIPLKYSATIDTMMGTQVDIAGTLIDNHQPSILLNPATRYTTISVLMDGVDWTANKCDKITLDVNATGKDEAGTSLTLESEHRFLTYAPVPAGGPAHNPPRYLTWAHPKGATIDFTWKASYIVSGTGHTVASGSGSSSDPQIIVPANGSGEVIPPPTPVLVSAASGS